MKELLYKDITYDIRGACFWVWKEFRGAFKEKIIDNALTLELKKRGRVVEDQKRLDIKYRGTKVGTYVPDKIIDGKVLVELKSKEFLTIQDIDQFWKYLKGSKYKVGLLINFGPTKLEIKRVVYGTAREQKAGKNSRLYQRSRFAFVSAGKGFTLMEIVVATTIFAIVVSALMSLFNQTLKINRKSEALRQATQGMRSFVEFLVKEVRNGQINYFIVNGSVIPSPSSPIGPCVSPGFLDTPTYSEKENKLGIIGSTGEEECVYFGDELGNPLPLGTFKAPAGSNYTLVLERSSGIKKIINPSNFRIESLMFLIRPIKDPYTSNGGLSEVQPFVNIDIKFVAELPTGEKVPIYYQTTVSTNKYDIPTE